MVDSDTPSNHGGERYKSEIVPIFLSRLYGESGMYATLSDYMDAHATSSDGTELVSGFFSPQEYLTLSRHHNGGGIVSTISRSKAAMQQNIWETQVCIPPAREQLSLDMVTSRLGGDQVIKPPFCRVAGLLCIPSGSQHGLEIFTASYLSDIEDAISALYTLEIEEGA